MATHTIDVKGEPPFILYAHCDFKQVYYGGYRLSSGLQETIDCIAFQETTFHVAKHTYQQQMLRNGGKPLAYLLRSS